MRYMIFLIFNSCLNSQNILCTLCFNAGPVLPLTIEAPCCAIPFTLNGTVHHGCVEDGGGVGCFYGDRQWKLCQQPAGK